MWLYTAHPVFNHPAQWAAAYISDIKYLSFFIKPEHTLLRGKDMGTLLHYAALYNSNPEVLKFLIQKGVNASARDQYNKTAVYYTVRNKQKFKILAFQKSRRYWKTPAGSSLFHFMSAHARDPDLISIALKAGADAQVRNQKGDTALHSAAANNPHPPILESLLKGIHNVDITNNHHLTLLHKAAAKNLNAEVIKLLLKKGAKVSARDSEYSTPLHWAAGFNSNPEVLKVLIAAHADVNAVNRYGDTPFLWGAGRTPHPEVLNVFMQNKLVGLKTKGRNQESPMHKAAASNPRPEVIKFLAAQNWDINQPDADGNTPLHWAAGANPSAGVVSALLKLGALVNQKDYYGNTALHLAAKQNKRSKILLTLLLHKADPKAANKKKETPLHYAVGVSAVQKAKLLITAGADVNTQDIKKRTPLHWAVAWGFRPGLVELLLRLGANACSIDSQGRVPVDYADEYPGVIIKTAYQLLKAATVKCGI